MAELSAAPCWTTIVAVADSSKPRLLDVTPTRHSARASTAGSPTAAASPARPSQAPVHGPGPRPWRETAGPAGLGERRAALVPVAIASLVLASIGAYGRATNGSPRTAGVPSN